MLTNQALAEFADYDAWLDARVSDIYKDQPLAQDWARVTKVGEELGEAISALIAATGQNPRKGQSADGIDAVLSELADVVITGVLAIHHFTKSPMQTQNVLDRKLHHNMARSGLTQTKARNDG